MIDPLVAMALVAIVPASLLLTGLVVVGLVLAALAAPVQLIVPAGASGPASAQSETIGPADRMPSPTPSA